jgi:hypothetical protein
MLNSHDEWARKRIGRFTASEIWKLFTDPRSKADKDAGKLSETAMTYVMEKAIEEYTGFRKKFTSSAIEHGVSNEKEAFDSFCSMTGLPFTYCSKEYYPISPIAGASPDGVLYDNLEPIAVLDVKCPQPVTFFEELTWYLKSDKDDEFGGITKTYYYQLQFQMLATKTPTSFLAYYLAKDFTNLYTGEVEHTFDLPVDRRMFFVEIKANESVQKNMVERIEKAERIKQSFIRKWKGEND